jgi:hypothetical protein
VQRRISAWFPPFGVGRDATDGTLSAGHGGDDLLPERSAKSLQVEMFEAPPSGTPDELLP